VLPLVLIALPSLAQEPAGSMGPPALRSGFALTDCCIIHPASDAGLAQANRIAVAIATAGGRAVIVPAADALDASGLRLTDEIAAKPHILLGNINTNRGLLAYYADLLDFSDAYHPGGDGYVLRTIPHGCGRGGDALIVGASSDAGLRRAADRLIELLAGANGPALPYVFEARLEGKVTQAVPLGSWPEPFDSQRYANTGYYDMAYLPGYAYALTGHLPAAQVALAGLLKGAAQNDGWYPVSDYQLEWLTRSWSYVRDAPCVSEADAQTIDNAFLQTLYHDQNEYWRARDGNRIGSRHQTMGTSAFYTGVRLLLRRGNPDETARAQLEQWKDQCAAYFANATQTFHDDMEGIPSYHSFQPVANEALRSGVADYFGQNLDWAVQRALAVTDNLGFYAGTGTYEEARPGTTRTGIMLGYPLAMAANLKGDAGCEWLLRHLPGTGLGMWGLVVGWGARGFARAADVPAEEPRDLLGILTVPLGPYREARLNPRPQGTPFEKLCLRDSYDARGQFMVLQGYQDIGADNLPPRDANSIIRYTDLGHIWLYANSERSGNFHRNAVYVSDGLNETWGAPVCDLLANLDSGPVAVAASRLRDYVASDWTRHVFWRKGRYHILIDVLTQTREGDFTATCTFRTPCAAELTDTGMRAWEGDAEMRVVNADGVPQSFRRNPGLEGAAIPTFLRQRRPLAGAVGKHTVFRNLIHASDPGRPLALDVRPVGEFAVMVRGEMPEGEEIALMGACPKGEEIREASLEASSPLFFVSPDAVIALLGAVKLGGLALGPEVGQVQLRAALAALWDALPEVGAPDQAALPRRPAERVFSFAGFTPRGQAILGPDITVEPPPTSGLALDLIDGTIPLWQAVSFPSDRDIRLRLDLRRTKRIESVEIATGLLTGTNVVPDPAKLPAARPAAIALDGRPQPAEFACGFTYEPLHKGVVCPMGRWRANLGGATARELQIVLPKDAWPAGAGVREVIVRRAGTNEVAPTHLRQADINADGKPEFLLAADTGEVVCLASGGAELWRRTLGGPITALECIDLGDGPPAILATTREARLYRLIPTGDVAWIADFIHEANENGDLPTAYSIGRWTDRDGKPEIVCGNYNACSFVTPDGARVEYCRASGAFETMMLPEALDLNGDGIEDQLLYNVWQSLSIIDGAQRKTVGGRSAPGGEELCMAWWRKDANEPLLLIGAENGVGLMNANTGEYRWRRNISPLSACAIGDFGGEVGRAAVVAKRDGFVLAFNEAGEIVRSTRVDELLECATVVALPDGASRLVAATDDHLILFDADLRNPVAIADGTGTKLVALAEPGAFAALRPTATIDVFRIQ
jgi:hypothetical protein